LVNWWLTTISLVGFLMILIGLVLFALKNAVNTEDAYRIDNVPNDEKSENKD
jgi:uncharacterized membrane protein